MKKVIGIASGLLTAALFATPVFAQFKPLCPEAATNQNFSQLCNLAGNPGAVLRNIVIILLLAAVVIALFFLIWGGIKWILSGGDKSAVEGARNTVIAAIVGLVIAFLAFFIINLIGTLFGVSINDLTLPKIF